jgi:hypothetical protein
VPDWVTPLAPAVGIAFVGVVELGALEPLDVAAEEDAGVDALWRGSLGVNPGGRACATRSEAAELPPCWGSEPAVVGGL